jgi:RHS repeat-associated protein
MPFGSLSAQEGTANVAHKFTGQRFDASTGLYFYNARYYDPELGRFISPDVIISNVRDPQEFNRYSYVRNNPVNFTDPSGHKKWYQFLGFDENPFRHPEAILDRFRDQISPHPESPQWWINTFAPASPVSPQAMQDAQRALQATTTFLVEQWGFSNSGAAAFIGGGIGFLLGGPAGAAYGATTAFISAEIMETRAAQQAVTVFAEALIDVGVSEQAAYTASATIISAGVGAATGAAVSAAAGFARGFVNGLKGSVDSRGSNFIRPPPNRGFAGSPERITLRRGNLIDRYGGSDGYFASPAGTPLGQRSLAPEARTRPLQTYRVIKPIPEVDAGPAAPWYGQRGGGIQYDFGNRTIQQLIDSGHLVPVQ